MIYIVDFGSQTAHLIKRRIEELGAKAQTVSPDRILQEIEKQKPQGIIFSGGPASVYAPKAPSIDPKVFKLGIPILGICYGLQLMSHLLGGKVVSGQKEYGPATLTLTNNQSPITPSNGVITNHLSKNSQVWMSHGDEVVKLPQGFKVLGVTETIPNALVEDVKRGFFGVQFHPEVEHTQYGIQILKNFLSICYSEFNKSYPEPVRHDNNDLRDLVQGIKNQVQNDCVIGAVSGGIDSTVAAYLTAQAIGKNFFPVYVENGLMREGTKEFVQKIFKYISVKPVIVECEKEMLSRLKSLTDPETKRKAIGAFYIEIFEREYKRLKKFGYNIKYLMQGTIYSDVIESQGTTLSDKIKSHHNVGGLPEKMKLKLLEPLREMYKDEVRKLGTKLGLPKEFVWKQPFPGPGYAVRIRGEVTKERLENIKQADKIVLEELEKAGWLNKVFLSFPIMTGSFSTAVKGDERFFGEVIALRVIESKDVMTAHVSELPYSLLQKIASRIVNEVPKISRVVYDITTKPPATMEWE